MRPPHVLPLILLAALAGSACFASSTVVRLQPDGSGTIDQTIAMRADAAAEMEKMLAGFAAMGAREGQKPATPELFGEAEMRAAAAKMGEGVTFVSSTPIKTPERIGRRATYAFTDIRTLRLDQKPAAGTADVEVLGSKAGVEPLTFDFVRLPNGHSRLSVRFPEARPQPAPEEEPGTPAATRQAPTPEQLEMASKLVDGLRIDLALEVAGRVVQTNAVHVDGPRITLLEMDFSQLLGNDQVLGQLSQPASFEDAKAVLRNLKGFKINLDRELIVEFAPQR